MIFWENKDIFIEIILFVKKEEQDKFDECNDKITHLIDNSLSVPACLIKEFIGYFKHKVSYEEELAKLKAEELLTKVKLYFDEYKDYLIKGNYYLDFEKKYKAQYTIYDCIYEVLYKYFRENDIVQRDVAIRFFYNGIDDYFYWLRTKCPPKLTPYKKGVIAAYLAIAVGFKLTTSTSFTNEMLFQSTRNALKKKH